MFKLLSQSYRFSTLSWVFGGLIIWRLSLAILSWLAPFWFPYAPSFPYFDSLLPSYGLSQDWYSWANFDGVHYLTIVAKGYVGTGLIQAFFPVYPALMWLGSLVTGNALVSGLAISHLAVVAGVYVAWQWWRQDQGEKVALWSLLAWLVFPTSFFLVGLYTESVFFLWVAASFWAARRQNWVLAGVMAALASATRIVGIWLVPALVLEWFWGDGSWLPGKSLHNFKWGKLPLAVQERWHELPHKIPVLASLAIGSLGLFSYMLYLYLTFGDPLYFLHVQAEFGAGRQESLVLWPQVVWRAIKIVTTYQAIDWRLWTYAQELVFGVGLALGLAWSATKQRWSYVLFAVLAYLTPTLTGTFSSIARYGLVCFPIFLMLGEWLATHRWLRWVYLVLSTIVLAINVMLFIQGYWVA